MPALQLDVQIKEEACMKYFNAHVILPGNSYKRCPAIYDRWRYSGKNDKKAICPKNHRVSAKNKVVGLA